MEEKSVQDIITATHKVRMFAVFALAMAGVFLFVAAIGQLKGLAYIGSGVPASNTISVSGEGEVFAIPDTATFTFTVDETAKDVATAQTSATKKANDIIAYLKDQSIADTDVQTTDYNINPQYSYQQAACPNVPVTNSSSGSMSSQAIAVYCPPGKQTITGYEVSQTVSVKVRDTSKAGTILAGVGSKGVSNVSGLSLTVSNENALELQARDKAIADAKAKADALASSLGVQLVRIVGYNENGGQVYYPKAINMAMGASDSRTAAPSMPTGQNKITSDISITYEIR